MTTAPRTLLAFDYGKQRIGIAVGQELTKSATPLVTLQNSAGAVNWSAIDELIQQWQPQALVVGLPLNADGTEHVISRAAKQFGNQLQARYNLTIYWVDERLTSIEAQRALTAGRGASGRKGAGGGKKARRADKSEIDRMAAKLILESWFNQQ
ncbi:MAG: Holliday junction resolvase RuvX [Gammaproteobacteria bacterium]